MTKLSSENSDEQNFSHGDSTQILRAMRTEYQTGELHRADLSDDPFAQFGVWLNDAVKAKVCEPNAMSVATVDASGQPSLRTVLLRGADENGFVFFTNYEGRKGREIAHNPCIALLLHWEPLHRQVSVRGIAERATAQETAEYFAARPFDSRVGAWASRQSTVIQDRDEVQAAADEFREKFLREYHDGSVPVHPWWGGIRVRPTSIEFWQGRENRLHDRFVYTRESALASTDHPWQINRLAP